MSLEKDLLELDCLNDEISKILENPDTTPSKKIMGRRQDLERAIFRRLKGGERIENPVLDYCLTNFVGKFSPKGIGGRIKSIFSGSDNSIKYSALDFVPKVEKFAGVVEKNLGQKILSVYDGLPDEFGVISGGVQYHLDRGFRTLYVPVEKLLATNGGKWENKKDALGVYITSHIFSSPSIFSFYGNNTWKTSHSGDIYVGGNGPGETEIYIGNKRVERELEKERTIIIPEREKTISFRAPNS